MHISKEIEWNADKAEILLRERNINMNEIADIIKEGNVIASINVPNQMIHPEQRMFIINYRNYTYCVPFVAEANVIFLKTVFPSRFYHKKYGGNND